MFLQTDYRYLRSRAYLEFVKEDAHITWWFLRARIYRPPKGKPGHPDYVGFYNHGWLAAHCSAYQLANDWMGLRGRKGVRSDLEWLESRGLIEIYTDPDQKYPTIFRLGSWSLYTHPQGENRRAQTQIIEVLFADRIFLLDESEPWAEE